VEGGSLAADRIPGDRLDELVVDRFAWEPAAVEERPSRAAIIVERSAAVSSSPRRAARSRTSLSGAACPCWILLWMSANSGSRSAMSTIEGRIDDHRAVVSR
jgi:hypothetical protein